MVAKGAGGGDEMDWEFGVSRCQLLLLGCISNKILLYSIGNYVQSPGMIVMEDNTRKGMCVCVCVCVCVCLLLLFLFSFLSFSFSFFFSFFRAIAEAYGSSQTRS